MNRRTFAAQIGKKTGHPANAIAAVLEAAIAVLAGELAKTGRFAWRDFGTFTVRTYPARKIHNPATGQTIELSARRSVTFKPSARLRSQVKPASTTTPRRSERRSRKRRTR